MKKIGIGFLFAATIGIVGLTVLTVVTHRVDTQQVALTQDTTWGRLKAGEPPPPPPPPPPKAG